MATPDESDDFVKRYAMSNEEYLAILKDVRRGNTGKELVNPQPPPEDVEGEDCWQLVIKDMVDRRAMGVRKYRMPVRALNGRDALVDAYQELLDLCVYLRQEIEKRRISSSVCGG